MIKSVISGSFAFDEQAAAIVPLHKRGIDAGWAEKRAAAPLFDFNKIASEAKENEELVHLLALGDGESVGANRNGDYFPRKANQDYHQTFLKAHYFHNHNNKDPKKSFGRVLASAHNAPMGRVELIVGIDKNKAADDLDELEKKGEFPVSMACFEDPSTPVFTDRGYVPIADVQVGDRVLTHAGAWKRVTEVIARPYTGVMVDLRVRGLPRTFSVTAEHPFFSVSQQNWARAAKGSKRNGAVAVAEQLDWCHTGCLQARDRVAGVIPSTPPGVAVLDDSRLAALLGYYLAEGSLGYNRTERYGKRACTVNFTINKSDSAVKLIPMLLEELWPGITVRIRAHQNSRFCLNLEIFSTELAEFIREQVGVGAKTKVIPLSLFSASREVRLAFLGAWADGDGWFDKKGLHWSTASELLALSGRDLLATLGIGASIYCIDHSQQPNTFGKQEWTLNISALDIAELRNWSWKAQTAEIKISETNKPCSWRPISASLATCAITGHRLREVTDITVYNLEVEDDHSYSAAGLASHNCRVPLDTCSICGNKAKTRAEYCKHAATMMGRIMDDGKMAYVINDHPDFFDLSKVFRGADRVAFTFRRLEKAAAEGTVVGGAELAEILQVADSALPGLPSAFAAEKIALLQRFAELDTVKLASVRNALRASDLSEEQLALLKSSIDLGAVFGELHRAGVCLPLSGFLALTGLNKEARISVDAVRSAMTGIFSRILENGDADRVCRNGSYDGTTAPVSMKVATAIWSLRKSHSLLPEYVQSRAIEKAASAPAVIYKIASASPQSQVLAEEYAAYLLSFAKSVGNCYVQNLTALCTER